MERFDLIVIGAGPGGYVAALRAAQLGKKTAVVEQREVGGTCLNRGCVPTKALLHASEVYHNTISGGALGVVCEGVRADLQAMAAYKTRVTEQLRSGVEQLLKRAKVTVLRGRGTILGTGRVRVTGEDGAAEYTCTHVIAATGAVPARPPIPGLELEGVVTSDELLSGTPGPFDSVVIIGGGVIGVEFATFFNDLGCRVTVLEGLDRLLPNMDRELGQSLAMLLKKRGVTVQTGAMVRSVEKTEDALRVNFVQKDKPGFAEGETVLCAIGRRPYHDGLFAEGLQPELDGRRLKVDDRYETSIPGVYAIGDVSGRVQLAHAASAQGTACVELLCALEPKTSPDLIPGCIYCRPEIASVGLTEAEAKAAGIPTAVGKAVMSGNARTVIAGGERGFIKLVAHAETGVLLGAQLMCERSTDMISQLSQAIANRMTPEQLLKAMRPHPTFEESMTDALQALCAKLG